MSAREPGDLRELRERLSWLDVGYEGTPVFDGLIETLAEAGYKVVKDEPRVSPLPHDPLTDVHCVGCGTQLFAHELFYYGNSCGECQTKWHDLMSRDDDGDLGAPGEGVGDD